MLSVNHLSKDYRNVHAVDDVSFFVAQGEIAVLVGPNGAGKSTTIQSIVGLLRFQGDIRIGDEDNHSLVAKKMLAFVPEMPAMYPLLNVRQHIEFMARAYDCDVSSETIDQLLDRFDLTDKQDKLGNELSKGMMQKVSICCALVVNPQVIILDEPMVGLDPKAIKVLKETLIELREENKTILISTHMMGMVEEIWDRAILLKQGRLIGNFQRDELGDEALETRFFELTGETHE